MTQGGYSHAVVVREHFVIRIPPGVDLAATTPLLCAGVTTFSPTVANERGTSIVCDDPFSSDRDADAAFRDTLAREGIEAFLDAD